MNNAYTTVKNLVIYNAISLSLILIILLSSSSIGNYLLNSKVEFLNEDAAYWIAQSIEVDTVHSFCLLIGLLNISLIAVSVNHILKK
ncbi:hypothetical protein [Peribacillus frigoritolerans]|uniref:hypothetical protein n=1 Tax=Peribacillus frigoritolerans TaxID=450367 RepID=UPI00105A6580|nr:hypothetical protein [Peribacillus frigoritolerans]TDL78549.1 hypothetical protein E2R53_13845 [Peribacillus frigoritolerans]